MKKRKGVLILFVLLLAVYLLLFFGEPPIREELKTDPREYLKTNRYVKGLREEFAEEGSITDGFFPSQINAEQTVSYRYWYACALLGDPNYAITVTIQFPTDEALQRERERINDLEGFSETVSDDSVIIGGKRIFKQLEGFFEPPVLDGSRYTMEYAIISMENRTITYSEVCIWENQIIDETIKSQLKLVYKGSP